MPVFAKLMPNYVSASMALAFAGLLNGYDTGSIGAIVHMKQFAASVGSMSATILGITVSMVMLTGIVPALLGGHLADKYGRLHVIIPGAVLFGIGAAMQATAFSLGQFIAGRAITGAGQGLFYANVSVYITEIAPQGRRGRLAAMPQFMAALGVCVGYFCCYCTSSVKSSLAWRLPYIVQVTVSIQLALVCLALPESPRWLLLHGRAQEALRSVQVLDFNMDEARRDFLDNPQEQTSLPTWQSFVLLFRGGYRPRTLLALFVLSIAQLSGIDAITYVSATARIKGLLLIIQYAPTLFMQAGISTDSSSLIASGVSSITMLVVSIPAFLLADKWGRRTSTVTGGLCLSGIMFLIGTLYAAGAVHPTGAARWVVVVSVFMFGMIFCATWGITSKIYASEIQPGNTRAAGNSVGMAFNFVSLSRHQWGTQLTRHSLRIGSWH